MVPLPKSGVSPLIPTMDATDFNKDTKQPRSSNNTCNCSKHPRWQCAVSAELPRRPMHHRQRSNRWRSSSDIDLDSTPAPPGQRRVPSKCESLPGFPTYNDVNDIVSTWASHDADLAPRRPCRRSSIGQPNNPEGMLEKEASNFRDIMAKSKYMAEFTSRKSLLSKSSSSISDLSFTSILSTDHQDGTSIFSLDETEGNRKDLSQCSGSFASLNDSNNLLEFTSTGNVQFPLDEKINHCHVKAYRRCMLYKSKSFTRKSNRSPLMKTASLDDVLAHPKTDSEEAACVGRRSKSLDRYEEKECLFQEAFSIAELHGSFVSIQSESK